MSGQEATNSLDRDPGVTDEIPIVPYRVIHAEIPFYSDPECTQEVPEAKITILEMLDPDDTLDELDVINPGPLNFCFFRVPVPAFFPSCLVVEGPSYKLAGLIPLSRGYHVQFI